MFQSLDSSIPWSRSPFPAFWKGREREREREGDRERWGRLGSLPSRPSRPVHKSTQAEKGSLRDYFRGKVC